MAVFHWSVSGRISLHISWILLSILIDLNNYVIWIVSPHSFTSKYYSPSSNPWLTVPRAPIIISITVTFMFHCLFFQFPGKVDALNLIFVFFRFYSVFNRESKVHNSASFLFLVVFITTSFRLTEIRWFICFSKPQRSLRVSFSRADAGSYIYHLFRWLNFTFLHNFIWITFPTQFPIILYSFCANLLHSLCD